VWTGWGVDEVTESAPRERLRSVARPHRSYPQAFLKGYAGTLMTDGYSAWRTLEGVTHLGCLAHARRAFDEAYKALKKPDGRARKALEYFKALYQVETLAHGKLPEGQIRADYTYRLRQTHSLPLLEAFKIWLDEQAPQALPESLTGKAISYTRNQWEYLRRYVEDGHAPIDNNVLERDIRPFTTGRKAWLFSDTIAGAKASAIIYSLMLTCRACNVELSIEGQEKGGANRYAGKRESSRVIQDPGGSDLLRRNLEMWVRFQSALTSTH
jgi:transposase